MSDDLIKAAKAALEEIHVIHKAFGAPGDHGHETKEGSSLYGLYRAGNNLQAEINKTESTGVV
jgi:hypothetical protein